MNHEIAKLWLESHRALQRFTRAEKDQQQAQAEVRQKLAEQGALPERQRPRHKRRFPW